MGCVIFLHSHRLPVAGLEVFLMSITSYPVPSSQDLGSDTACDSLQKLGFETLLALLQQEPFLNMVLVNMHLFCYKTSARNSMLLLALCSGVVQYQHNSVRIKLQLHWQNSAQRCAEIDRSIYLSNLSISDTYIILITVVCYIMTMSSVTNAAVVCQLIRKPAGHFTGWNISDLLVQIHQFGIIVLSNLPPSMVFLAVRVWNMLCALFVRILELCPH